MGAYEDLLAELSGGGGYAPRRPRPVPLDPLDVLAGDGVEEGTGGLPQALLDRYLTPLEPTAPAAPAAPDPAPVPVGKDREPLVAPSSLLHDLGVSAQKGAVSALEFPVGLADIVSGGRAGKALEGVGFHPGLAKRLLEEDYSPAQQAANREVQEADGLLDTISAVGRNPSVIPQTIVESLPLMLGGAGVARVAAKLGMGALAAGALGEGLAGAGSAAEQIRQETPEGLLSPGQAAAAAASGAFTGALGVLGGRIAERLGIADVDTLLARAVRDPDMERALRQMVKEGVLEETPPPSLLKQVGYGAFSEGVLEEAPQSIQEQMLQNAALDRPLTEGIPQAAVLGTLAGAAMGGGANVVTGLAQEPASDAPPPRQGTNPVLEPYDIEEEVNARLRARGGEQDGLAEWLMGQEVPEEVGAEGVLEEQDVADQPQPQPLPLDPVVQHATRPLPPEAPAPKVYDVVADHEGLVSGGLKGPALEQEARARGYTALQSGEQVSPLKSTSEGVKAERTAFQEKETAARAADVSRETAPTMRVEPVPNLTPEAEAMQRATTARVQADPDAAVAAYNAHLQKIGKPNLISSDEVKEVEALFPEYTRGTADDKARLTLSIHAASRAVGQEALRRRLAEPVPANEEAQAIVLTGGSGAGKTTAVKGEAQINTARANIVYDTVLQDEKVARNIIDRFRKAGRRVTIVHVQRDVADSMDAVIERSLTEGRVVNASYHLRAHFSAGETLLKLAKHYEGDPNVEFIVLDNTRASQKLPARLADLDFVQQVAYNRDPNARLAATQATFDVIHAARAAGRISDTVYQELLGGPDFSGPRLAAREGRGREAAVPVHAEGRRGDAPEPQREGRPVEAGRTTPPGFPGSSRPLLKYSRGGLTREPYLARERATSKPLRGAPRYTVSAAYLDVSEQSLMEMAESPHLGRLATRAGEVYAEIARLLDSNTYFVGFDPTPEARGMNIEFTRVRLNPLAAVEYALSNMKGEFTMQKLATGMAKSLVDVMVHESLHSKLSHDTAEEKEAFARAVLAADETLAPHRERIESRLRSVLEENHGQVAHEVEKLALQVAPEWRLHPFNTPFPQRPKADAAVPDGAPPGRTSGVEPGRPARQGVPAGRGAGGARLEGDVRGGGGATPAAVGAAPAVRGGRPAGRAERSAEPGRPYRAVGRVLPSGKVQKLQRVGPGDSIVLQSSTQQPAPIFFSALRRAVEHKNLPNAATGAEWLKNLKSQKGDKPGKPPSVKGTELFWTGLEDFLTAPISSRDPGRAKVRVTRQEILDFLDKNQVIVKETLLGRVAGKKGTRTGAGGDTDRIVETGEEEIDRELNESEYYEKISYTDDISGLEFYATGSDDRGWEIYADGHSRNRNIASESRERDIESTIATWLMDNGKIEPYERPEGVDDPDSENYDPDYEDSYPDPEVRETSRDTIEERDEYYDEYKISYEDEVSGEEFYATGNSDNGWRLYRVSEHGEDEDIAEDLYSRSRIVEEILDWLNDNRPTPTAPTPAPTDAFAPPVPTGSPQYETASYREAGGANYRELVFSLPEAPPAPDRSGVEPDEQAQKEHGAQWERLKQRHERYAALALMADPPPPPTGFKENVRSSGGVRIVTTAEASPEKDLLHEGGWDVNPDSWIVDAYGGPTSRARRVFWGYLRGVAEVPMNALHKKMIDETLARIGRPARPKSVPADTETRTGPHYSSIKNLLAHVRFDEYTTKDGKRVLFIQEIQDDIGNAIRAHEGTARRIKAMLLGTNLQAVTNKGAKLKKVLEKMDTATRAQEVEKYAAEMKTLLASGGFGEYTSKDERLRKAKEYVGHMKQAKKLKEQFAYRQTSHELVFKRMLRWAAEQGFDKLAWSTGAQQNKRWSLHGHITKLIWEPRPNGMTAVWIEGGQMDVPKILERIHGAQWDEQAKAVVVPNEALAELTTVEYANKMLAGEGKEVEAPEPGEEFRIERKNYPGEFWTGNDGNPVGFATRGLAEEFIRRNVSYPDEWKIAEPAKPARGWRIRDTDADTAGTTYIAADVAAPPAAGWTLRDRRNNEVVTSNTDDDVPMTFGSYQEALRYAEDNFDLPSQFEPIDPAVADPRQKSLPLPPRTTDPRKALVFKSREEAVRYVEDNFDDHAQYVIDEPPPKPERPIRRELSGLHLKVEGPGKKKTYDEVFPNFMREYIRKQKWMDTRLGKVDLGFTMEQEPRYEGPDYTVAEVEEKTAHLRERYGDPAQRYHMTYRDQDLATSASAAIQRMKEGATFQQALQAVGHSEFMDYMGGRLTDRTQPELVHAVDISPSMKQSVLYEGQPQFMKREPAGTPPVERRGVQTSAESAWERVQELMDAEQIARDAGRDDHADSFAAAREEAYAAYQKLLKGGGKDEPQLMARRPPPGSPTRPPGPPDFAGAYEKGGGDVQGKPGGTPDLGLNIRKYDWPPDVAHRVAAAVAELDAAGALDRDTPMTLADLNKEASDIMHWISPEDLRKSFKSSGPKTVAMVRAMRMVLMEGNERLEVARKTLIAARQGGGSQAIADAHAEYQKESTSHAADISAFAGKVTEAARILAFQKAVLKAGRTAPEQFRDTLFKILHDAGVKKREVQTVFDLYMKSLSGMEADKVAFIEGLRRAFDASTTTKITELWKAMILSGPSTPVANVIGNSLTLAADIAKTGVAGVLDSHSNLTGADRQRYVGEMGAQIGGIRNALPGALKQLMADLTTIRKLGAEDIDLKGGKLEYQVGAIGPGYTPFHFGRAVRIPFRLLTATDNFFKILIAGGEMSKIAYRDGQKKGYSGHVLEQHMRDVIQGIKDGKAAYAEMAKEVEAAQDRLTFQNDLGTISGGIQGLKRNQPWLEFIVPFIKTPVNIGKMTWQMTPGGLIKIALDLKAGKPKGDILDNLALTMVGTVLGGAMIAAARGGFLTGSGPADERERELLKRTGWQPYSVRWQKDGKTYYVGFSRFEPIGAIMGIAGDIVEAQDETKARSLVEKLIGTIMGNFTSKTYLAGLSDFFTFWHDPINQGPYYVKQLSGTVVPNLLARTAQAIDPVIRDEDADSFAGKIGKHIVSRVPGASKLLEPRYSATGKEKERGGTWLSRLASPAAVSSSREGVELEKELIRLGYIPQEVKHEARLPGGLKLRLTDYEFALMHRANLRAAAEAQRLMRSTRYRSLPDTEEEGGTDSKEHLMRQLFAKHRAEARARVGKGSDFKRRIREAQAEVSAARRNRAGV